MLLCDLLGRQSRSPEKNRAWPGFSRAFAMLLAALVPLFAGCAANSAAPPARAAGPSRAYVAHPQKLGAGITPSDLVIEPDDGYSHLIRALDRAGQHIFVETYILTDRRIVRALERAAAAGVHVNVLLEPHPLGMGSQPSDMADELRAAGIAVRWTWSKFALTHAKFIVIDDSTALISTANFSRSAFTRNREFLVFDRVTADVRVLSQLFRSDWDRLPDNAVDANLVVAPLDSRSSIRGLIAAAKQRLDLYAEEINDASAERLLIAAAARHVRVRVILAAQGGSAAARYLQGHGVQVHMLSSPYVHAKVIVVDGKLAFVGSENLSTQSLDRNREVGVLVRGDAIAIIEQTFAGDWGRATIRH